MDFVIHSISHKPEGYKPTFGHTPSRRLPGLLSEMVQGLSKYTEL